MIPDLDPELVEHASDRGWHLDFDAVTPSARYGPPLFALSARNSKGVVVGQCCGAFRSQNGAEQASLDEMRAIDAALDR